MLFLCIFAKTSGVSANGFDKCFRDIYRQYSKSSGVLRKDIKLRNSLPDFRSTINYAKNNNFPELYSNLIRGLDQESVNVVNRILVRFKTIYDNNTWEGATNDEVKKLNKLKKEFKIKKLNKNCFAWKDYLLPINHFEPSVFFYSNGITNFKKLDAFKNKDIIDVGGFIGDSAIVFSKYTNRNVYSFEPSSKNYQLMKKTIEMNKKTNIIPVQLGLGSKNQKARIPLRVSSCLSTNQSGSKKNFKEKTEVINVTTLDEYVAKHKLNVGLIKVDIEGNEQDFLKGATKTIKKHRPHLLISIYHNASDFFNIKPMIESLGVKYKFQIVKCVDGAIAAETLLIGTPVYT